MFFYSKELKNIDIGLVNVIVISNISYKIFFPVLKLLRTSQQFPFGNKEKRTIKVVEQSRSHFWKFSFVSTFTKLRFLTKQRWTFNVF